jgi:FAD synthase
MVFSNKMKKYIFIIMIIVLFFMYILNHKITENYDNINGKVIHGIGVSTKLDYPTANIKNNIGLDCGIYSGISNYGKCTIISFNKMQELEVHIHNFKKNIYNKVLKVKNIKKISNNSSGAIALINNGCNNR